MSTAEKKRRLTDDISEPSVSSTTVPPTRPPLKKRFTSCVNIQQTPVVQPEPEPVTKPVKKEFSVNILITFVKNTKNNHFLLLLIS